jgi:hypothetical protein
VAEMATCHEVLHHNVCSVHTLFRQGSSILRVLERASTEELDGAEFVSAHVRSPCAMAGDSATVVAAVAEQMVMLRAYLELLQYGQRI